MALLIILQQAIKLDRLYHDQAHYKEYIWVLFNLKEIKLDFIAFCPTFKYDLKTPSFPLLRGGYKQVRAMATNLQEDMKFASIFGLYKKQIESVPKRAARLQYAEYLDSNEITYIKIFSVLKKLCPILLRMYINGSLVYCRDRDERTYSGFLWKDSVINNLWVHSNVWYDIQTITICDWIKTEHVWLNCEYYVYWSKWIGK